jgi:hypothetical protein
MTDWQAEGVYTKRVPADQFEAQLYRQTIEAEIAKWQTISTSVSQDHVDGVWELSVRQRSEDLDLAELFTAPFIFGTVWVAEREYPASESYRVVVVWSLGSQTNTTAGRPVLNWDKPNPAGPWD